MESEPEARGERMNEATEAIRFRSLLDRSSTDQLEAVRRGYHSVEGLAIDELGRFCHELLERVQKLEAHAVEEARHVDGLGRAR